jgi:hypothetical protein
MHDRTHKFFGRASFYPFGYCPKVHDPQPPGRRFRLSRKPPGGPRALEILPNVLPALQETVPNPRTGSRAAGRKFFFATIGCAAYRIEPEIHVDRVSGDFMELAVCHNPQRLDTDDTSNPRTRPPSRPVGRPGPPEPTPGRPGRRPGMPEAITSPFGTRFQHTRIESLAAAQPLPATESSMHLSPHHLCLKPKLCATRTTSTLSALEAPLDTQKSRFS